MHLVRECRRRCKFRPRLGPEGSDHTDLINLVAAGEGIMLEAQFLFERANGINGGKPVGRRRLCRIATLTRAPPSARNTP